MFEPIHFKVSRLPCQRVLLFDTNPAHTIASVYINNMKVTRVLSDMMLNIESVIDRTLQALSSGPLDTCE